MDRFSINAADSVLILIDIQTNLAAAMKKEIFQTTEKNINVLISACKTLGIPMIMTEQYRKGLGPTVKSVQDNLGPLFQPVEKLSFSCCANSAFRNSLEKLKKKYCLIAGIESHVCVLQTALELVKQDYYVHVVSDAVCSRFRNDWQQTLDLLRQAGAVVSTTEIAVFQLLKEAGTADFKTISPLFKTRER